MSEQSFKPYAGLLVVALEQAVAAPLASCHFAQGGARVIKVERVGGGDFARRYDTAVKGEASYFVWANHGKESLDLDIKHPDDLALLLRILEGADIFIQNLAPGAAERAGLGQRALRALNPQLITCSISGYGEAGAFRDMKAYDFLVQCESGLVAVNGAPGHPGRIGVSICDIGASMNAIIGIQTALYARTITGQGSDVGVSLFDTAADWMTVPLMHADYAGKAPQPAGLKHPSIAPYGGFETGDGEILAISIQNEREWENFCREVLERPELAIDPQIRKRRTARHEPRSFRFCHRRILRDEAARHARGNAVCGSDRLRSRQFRRDVRPPSATSSRAGNPRKRSDRRVGGFADQT